jgi:hypothetical protein
VPLHYRGKRETATSKVRASSLGIDIALKNYKEYRSQTLILSYKNTFEYKTKKEPFRFARAFIYLITKQEKCHYATGLFPH